MAHVGSTPVTSQRRSPPDAAHGGGCRVVVMRGEYDISSVASLSDTLGVAIAAEDADLRIDMSEVTFLDAATIGVVIRARAFLAERSRSLLVRSPSPCARRLLDICHLDALVEADADRATTAYPVAV
jgi:anti-anti-sigma factor